MKKHNFFALLLLFLLSHISYAEETNSLVDTYWIFDNISTINALGENNDNIRKTLKSASDQTTIEFTNDRIIIHNDLFGTSALCAKPYTIKVKTPLSYFYSEKTVNLYNTILAKEDNVFSEQIKVIKTGLNDSCPSPYEELIENAGRLIVINEYYLVFFRKSSKPITEQSFCKNLKKGQEFDGTLEYSCFYPNKSLKEIYASIVKYTDFLKEELPQKQLSYTMHNEHYNNIKISYKWINQQTLQLVIDLSGGNEVRTYLIEETIQGTKLYKTIETQY